MRPELYIAGAPHLAGGAGSEILHTIDLLRQHDVSVVVVPMPSIDPAMATYLRSARVGLAAYNPYVFKNKIVAAWCKRSFLCHLPEIIKHGRPRATIYFNCMTTLDRDLVQARCHAVGWIDRWGFVSAYQRGILSPILSKIAPVKELEGYKPYFNPDNPIQQIAYNFRPVTDEFVIGRISRDDPTKFSKDTWSLLERIKVPSGVRKKVLILGYGPQVKAALGDPPSTLDCEVLPPGDISPGEFYSRVHCIVHKTGGSRESYGRFVPEAYAAGVSVITERDFAFPELIEQGVTGMMGESTDQMADFASELACDGEMRRSMAENAREYLLKRLCEPSLCFAAWQTLFQENGHVYLR